MFENWIQPWSLTFQDSKGSPTPDPMLPWRFYRPGEGWITDSTIKSCSRWTGNSQISIKPNLLCRLVPEASPEVRAAAIRLAISTLVPIIGDNLVWPDLTSCCTFLLSCPVGTIVMVHFISWNFFAQLSCSSLSSYSRSAAAARGDHSSSSGPQDKLCFDMFFEQTAEKKRAEGGVSTSGGISSNSS